METEIGQMLREARIRHKVDLAHVEERTKIRVRYLRALENEEWDLLPGPTYTRSFIRTYASFLGLDGERLADDFRRQQEIQAAELAGGREAHPVPPRLARVGGGGPRFGAGLVGGIAALALVAVVVVLGVTAGGDGDGGETLNPSDKQRGQGGGQANPAANRPPGVSIRLTATAEVWVCAIAADGTPVVNGEILPAGVQEGPFRSSRFDLAFGNGGVDLEIDGKRFGVEDTPSPIGYSVTPNRVRVLPGGTRPDCT